MKYLLISLIFLTGCDVPSQVNDFEKLTKRVKKPKIYCDKKYNIEYLLWEGGVTPRIEGTDHSEYSKCVDCTCVDCTKDKGLK